MKNALSIELAAINRLVVVVIEHCSTEDLETFAAELRALDPNSKEFRRIAQSVTGAFDELIVISAPSPRLVLMHVRTYVGLERSRAAVRAAHSLSQSLEGKHS